MDFKKTFIVNDIAATSAGAYTILENFLEELSNNKAAQDYKWVIFVSCEEFLRYTNNYIQVINVSSKNWFTRIHWDLIGLRKWLKRNSINAYKLFSIQNTGIPFVQAPQFIYIHQPLILARKIKLKSFEWKIKLFRFIYFYCVKWTIKKGSKVIVQTEWMKEEVNKQLKVENKDILVLKPLLKIDIQKNVEKKSDFTYRLFYPAVPVVSYKNYELLIKTLHILKKINAELYKKIEVLITTEKDFNKLTSYYYKLSKRLKVSEKMKWCGYLNQKEMNDAYFNSDIFLFPSRLESFGLPLIEAAHRSNLIVTLNTGFSKELLKDYEKVFFIENDPLKWAEVINDIYKNGVRFEKGNRFNPEFKKERSIVEVLMD